MRDKGKSRDSAESARSTLNRRVAYRSYPARHYSPLIIQSIGTQCLSRVRASIRNAGLPGAKDGGKQQLMNREA